MKILNISGTVLYEDKCRTFKATLEAAVASGARLGGVDLRGANLTGADLRGASLGCARLDDAWLDGANLRCANLRCANMDGARLGGVDLRGAWMGGAKLTGAKLTGARLDAAWLGGARLDGADGILVAGPAGERMMYAVRHLGGPMIQAGCHWDTPEALRAHWQKMLGQERDEHARRRIAVLEALLTMARADGWPGC